MKDNTNSKFLQLLYGSTYIPMHYFHHEKLIATFPSWVFLPDQLHYYLNYNESTTKNVDYYSVEDYLYIGIVKNNVNGESVIVGPIAPIALSSEQLQKLITTFALDNDRKTEIEEYFQRTPHFSMPQFYNILAIINLQINNEAIESLSYFNHLDEDKSTMIATHQTAALIERKENELYHDTYYFELEYNGYIERGDVQGLIQFFNAAPSFTEGNIANDSIRQAKNIFISAITLATRYAIRGGLDIETAYELSDSYIKEVENMSDASQITYLNSTAMIDYAKRVSDAKIPNGMSKDIHMAIQYISNHVNQHITVDQIARELAIDRSTLSKKFSKELGFHISDFIMRRKLEEAKSLLIYTEKTISEISEYLCFSSQAYFQNVFKKKYNLTPKEFRKQNKALVQSTNKGI